MSKPYKVVDSSEVEFGSDPHALILNYSRIEQFYFPVLMSLGGVGISLRLAIVVSHERMSILAKFALLGGVMALSCLLFWYVIRHGAFVLAANHQGIYYRMVDNKNKLVFISWEAVKEIAVYAIEGSELEIETIFEGPAKLPSPCNGVSFVKGNGRLAVSLYLRMGRRRTSDIMNKIDDLKLSKQDWA
jgi:hypothetical protein